MAAVRKMGVKSSRPGFARIVYFYILNFLGYLRIRPVWVSGLLAKLFYDSRSWEAFYHPQKRLVLHMTPKCGSTTVVRAIRNTNGWKYIKIDPGANSQEYDAYSQYEHWVLYRKYGARMFSLFNEKLVNGNVLTVSIFGYSIFGKEEVSAEEFVDYVKGIDMSICDKHFYTIKYITDTLRAKIGSSPKIITANEFLSTVDQAVQGEARNKSSYVAMEKYRELFDSLDALDILKE